MIPPQALTTGIQERCVITTQAFDPDQRTAFDDPETWAHHAASKEREDERLAQLLSDEAPPVELTDYKGDPVPGPPPLKDGEEGEVQVYAEGTLAEMMLTEGPPKEDESWACSGVFKPGALTLVVGTQQSFKSWAMLDLMYHAAEGSNWLERGIVKYDAIVYVSNEKSKQAVYERMWTVFEERRDLAAKVYIFHREHRIHFGNEAWEDMVRWLKEEMVGSRILLVLDTLTSLAPAGYDENNLKDVSRVLDAIRQLQEDDRLDVMLVHHLNAMGERPRGHTALDGEVDGFVKFDRRGRDLDEVLVKFEPKDGTPQLQAFTFDQSTGLFKRATARALHAGNLRSVVQWHQERNNGEGMTVKELKERFFNMYRYDQVEAAVIKAEDALVLKRERRLSLITNREANIVTVMSDEERDMRQARRDARRVDMEEPTGLEALR